MKNLAVLFEIEKPINMTHGLKILVLTCLDIFRNLLNFPDSDMDDDRDADVRNPIL